MPDPTPLPEVVAGTVGAILTAASVLLAAGPAPMAPATTTPVATTAPVPSPPHAMAMAVGSFNVYFGNLHSHTSYSDGSGTPEEAFQQARANGLDFLAVTEHNHAGAESSPSVVHDGVLIATSPERYDGSDPQSLVRAAERMTVAGEFVALYGQEFSTISSGNHANVFDVRGVIDSPNGNFRDLVERWLPAHPDSLGTSQLIQLNHPWSPGVSLAPVDAGVVDDDDESARPGVEYGMDDFGGRDAWISAMDRHAELMEVFNGPGTRQTSGGNPKRTHTSYLAYLNLGFHVGPTGNQDNHYRMYGTTTNARTGVIARALTKSDLLSALKARHVFATLDRDLAFVARAAIGGQEFLMGDVIAPPAPGTPFEIRYELIDGDEPTVDYRIQVLADEVGGSADFPEAEAVTQAGNTAAGTPGRIQNLTYSGGRQVFVIKVTQDGDHGDDILWTAPIWFEQPSTTPPAGPDTSAFVASRNSGIFHVSADCRFAKQIAPANRVTGEQATTGRTMHVGCPVE